MPAKEIYGIEPRAWHVRRHLGKLPIEGGYRLAGGLELVARAGIGLGTY